MALWAIKKSWNGNRNRQKFVSHREVTGLHADSPQLFETRENARSCKKRLKFSNHHLSVVKVKIVEAE